MVILCKLNCHSLVDEWDMLMRCCEAHWAYRRAAQLGQELANHCTAFISQRDRDSMWQLNMSLGNWKSLRAVRNDTLEQGICKGKGKESGFI